MRTIGRMSQFADALARADGHLVLAELVPWAGTIQDHAGERLRSEARDLAADARVSAITITDNAGGHVRLGPLTLGHAIHDMNGEVLVHVACRERNRASLETLAYGLASEGLTNVLALSGDLPTDGYQGRSRPVFDIDSVGLLALLRDASAHGLHFTTGAAVNPFKALEADLVPQLLKLALKVRAGAAFAICQVGWDARSLHELIRWSEAQGLGIPLIAPVYILGRGVARVFHRDEIPGIRLSAELLAMVEAAAESPDKGRARFLELAAMQVAVARGLGYAGVYVAGQRDASEIDRVLSMADAYGPDDWRGMLAEVSYPEPGAHRLFEPGDVPQLASDRPARPGKAPGAPLFYRFNRLVHDHVFDPESKGFAVARAAYGRLEVAAHGQACPRARAGRQDPHVWLQGLRRLLAAGHRLPVPGGRLRQEPAQRTLRRLAQRPMRAAEQALHLGQRLRPSQALRGSAHHARSRACPAGQCATWHQRLGQHLHGP